MTDARQDEIERTRIVVEAWRQEVLASIRDFGTASKACIAADDITVTVPRLVEVVHGIEVAIGRLDGTKETEGLKTKARGYLASLMESTGSIPTRADGLVATLADAPRHAVVVDKTMIPPEYWTQPEPRIDTTKLAADLRRGILVPGAKLNNGGPQVLRISPTKKEDVAA